MRCWKVWNLSSGGYRGVYRYKHSVSCIHEIQALCVFYCIYVILQFYKKSDMWVLEWCHPQKAQPTVLNLLSCQHWEGPDVGGSSFSSTPPPACVLQTIWGSLTGGRKNLLAGVLVFWAVATSSLECLGGRGFLITIQLSAKVKTVSSGFLVALWKYLLFCLCSMGEDHALSATLFL